MRLHNQFKFRRHGTVPEIHQATSSAKYLVPLNTYLSSKKIFVQRHHDSGSSICCPNRVSRSEFVETAKSLRGICYGEDPSKWAASFVAPFQSNMNRLMKLRCQKWCRESQFQQCGWFSCQTQGNVFQYWESPSLNQLSDWKMEWFKKVDPTKHKL